MADTKLSGLTELAATPADNDESYIRDVSEAAAAESKRITIVNLLGSAILKSLLTTRGDIIYRNATVPARLAKGTSGHVLTMGANDPAWSAPLSLTVAETQVFSGASPSPSAWTDLDLSGTIGSNPALVLLKCYNASGTTAAFGFRINGDTEPDFIYDHPLSCRMTTLKFAYAFAIADSSGIVEWYFDQSGQASTTIDVVAYIK